MNDLRDENSDEDVRQGRQVLAEAMEGVQEALGQRQDSVLTRERLLELARHTSDTGAAFLYGRLYAMEEARAQDSRDRSTPEVPAPLAGLTSVRRPVRQWGGALLVLTRPRTWRDNALRVTCP